MPCHDRSMIQISQNAKANDLIKINPEDTHLVLPKEVIEEAKENRPSCMLFLMKRRWFSIGEELMNNEDHKELLETVSQIVKNNEIKMNQNPSIIEFIPQENTSMNVNLLNESKINVIQNLQVPGTTPSILQVYY